MYLGGSNAVNIRVNNVATKDTERDLVRVT